MATTQNRPAVVLSAGVKPAAATQKTPAAPVVVDAPVINDIAAAPASPAAVVEEQQKAAPVVADAAPVTPNDQGVPVQAWPVTVTVRNDSRASIVCPVCGLYSPPGSNLSVSLHDAEHARAAIQNIRELAARQNVSAEIVITGLPDGL